MAESTGDLARDKRNELAAAHAQLDSARTIWIAGDHDLHAQHPERIAALLLDERP
jgi:hypothetical protein